MAEPLEIIIGNTAGLLRREIRDNNTPSYHSEEMLDTGEIVDVDLTDEEYRKALESSGQQCLEDNRGEREISCEVEPNINYIFGKDYFIGDIVQVEDDFGYTDEVRVKEVIISHTKDEFKIYPTFESDSEQ